MIQRAEIVTPHIQFENFLHLLTGWNLFKFKRTTFRMIMGFTASLQRVGLGTGAPPCTLWGHPQMTLAKFTYFLDPLSLPHMESTQPSLRPPFGLPAPFTADIIYGWVLYCTAEQPLCRDKWAEMSEIPSTKLVKGRFENGNIFPISSAEIFHSSLELRVQILCIS